MQTQTLVLVKQRNHLETVRVNEPVVVNRGHQIVDVKPQVVSKGLVTGKVRSRMVQEGKAPDFVVCMGEDRSDEKMFESITTTLSAQSLHAKYFLDEVSDLVKLLQGLANTWSPKPRYPSLSRNLNHEKIVHRKHETKTLMLQFTACEWRL